jgi:anti-sigma factor RsiW
MNCQEFWDDPGAEPAAHRKAHLQECPACAAEWEAQRNLAAGLRQVAAGWSRMAAPARVEARLVNAFRQQAGITAEHPRAWFAAFTWAMAAAAVLVLAISLLRVHGPQSAAPKPVRSNAAILASVDEMPEGAAEASDGGFVPLPNVEQLAPNETGDVVRVEVPRSAMIAVGFEVSPERAAEPVEAEVMFGPDGVARAVRFLNETF